ncbi:phosphatidylserine decarboxylase-domain-containing protein [Ilyonectria robusta]|uniref:phosphatidylserine decarboxylase-domain-containing protein n=1 Tax=Ilyonectria robusta TaxID=1079257 RepID=UPI001E8E3602|nr:phosphatidylserine decarboxylase-domain-containing protein [Ilyonectria robusta]KAH8699947.1 phosphatidylserine decarboxylase-domain-containing protein [Ilyonectria robusta]
MVRIIPTRLKSSSSTSSSSTIANSRTNSPMRSSKSDTSPSRDAGNGLTLKVSIIKARNLAAKDRNGTSDPYIVLSLGDARVTTHTQPKTLNPEWNVSQEIAITSVQNLVLDVICWDKDRFGKDYLGEFDLALEEIFQNEKAEQEPTWFPLKSKRPGKKTSVVSGEVQLQFCLIDNTNPSATAEHILDKFYSLVGSVPVGSSRNITPSMTPSLAPTTVPPTSAPTSQDPTGDEDDDDDDDDLDDEEEDPSKPETAEKRRRRLRIKGLKKRRRRNPYAFMGNGSDVVGIIFLEIAKITDLPPESNLTRTSFDMDPFVVASLGKKTYRTQRVRHNLNPVFNEKMLFHVQGHEQQYSFAFTVIDHDKYSGNDFIASCNLPVQEIIEKAPKANLETGLYEVRVPNPSTPKSQARFKKLGLSRSSSTSSLSKIIRPPISKNSSALSTSTIDPAQATAVNRGLLTPVDAAANTGSEEPSETEDPDFNAYVVPLKMKNLDKWEDKHNPTLYLRAKYMPYPALRQQFWRAMLRQYDADESGKISRIELTTMLESLGSTLSETTIDGFFKRFPHQDSDNDDVWELTMDETVTCLEDELESKGRSSSGTVADKLKNIVPDMKNLLHVPAKGTDTGPTSSTSSSVLDLAAPPGLQTSTSAINVPELGTPDDEESDPLAKEDEEDRSDEHVVEIRECPICHQPRMNKRKDADIITHIATCASQDWRQVNNVLVGGFVTASQAQRKWYSKVITKISYGGYKLGANSANILVQDRMTGQINEEKMSVYVRLGIRLLYKGLKSRDMENKRIRKLLKSLSIKQGKKFDDPASKEEIEKFIEFHGLDMSEVLLPLDEFKNFNEFFYRALKPGARPCSAPDKPRIIVSPADCRSVVFNSITQATKIWVKGREFNMKRLLGDAYPEDVSRFEGGALGIFRLAPQDYHRFHIPVDGIMGKPKTIEGEYYTVNPMAIRSALDVYGENVRVLVPIDSEQHGHVMVICVGAMMVGSTVITRNEGDHVRRAEELGYFKFGGSTILLLFEPGRMTFDNDLVDNGIEALETLVRVGMSIGHSPEESQWMPDTLTSGQELTEAEKRDAKRRIQGNVALQDSPDGSGDDQPKARPTSQPTINTMAASAM